MRRALLTIPLVSLLALATCGIDCGADSEMRGRGDDGGPTMTTDDGGVFTPLPGPESNEPIFAGAGMSPPSALGGFESGDDYRTCFDELDNDDDGLIDCDDQFCSTLGTCRVGTGRACRMASPLTLDFGLCSGDPSACTATATLFGSPSPWVASGRLHPGGTNFDSGAIFPESIDLRAERLTLTGTFAPPTCGVDDPCVETVAMGVTSTGVEGATSRVTPIVALKLAGARQEMQLVVGSTVVRTFPFVEATPTWTLTLVPTGEVIVSQDGVPFATDGLAFIPEPAAHVVLYGRNMNRAEPAPDGASLSNVQIARALCDMPASWTSRDPVAFELMGSGSPWSVDSPTGVTALRVDGMLYLAFESRAADGQSVIVGTFETSAGPTRFRTLAELTAPLLETSNVPGAVALHDPELAFDGTTFHLFFTVETGNAYAPRHIGHASGPDLRALTVDGAVIDPTTWAGLARIEMPTAVYTELGVWVVAARVTTQTGVQNINVFSGASLSMLTRHRGALETLTERSNAAQRPTFDSEEIAAPSLVIGGSTFYLYYSGRRGTRWGVGLLATEDFISFRNVTPDAPILAGRVGTADALGPENVDVLIDADVVTLFYDASDGPSSTIFRATRTGAVLTP